MEKSNGELGCKCPPGASGRYCERGNFTTLKILPFTSHTAINVLRELSSARLPISAVDDS